MKAIAELQQAYHHYKLGLCGAKPCIDWALARLDADEEEGDLEIALLAGEGNNADVSPLVEALLEKYIGDWKLDEQLLCGKYIAELYKRHRSTRISAGELDAEISHIYVKLNYPSWLAMLSRNAEYQTDVEPFVKSFEDEFRYISELWNESSSTKEFQQKYDRKISDSHDAVDR